MREATSADSRPCFTHHASRNTSRSMPQAPPSSIAPGQRVTLTITDVAFGGEGVGRIEQFVVFVPFVIPGEEVEAEVTEVKKHFARARLLRLITPSAHRVSPRCAYFGECGGCQ